MAGYYLCGDEPVDAYEREQYAAETAQRSSHYEHRTSRERLFAETRSDVCSSEDDSWIHDAQ